MQRLLTLAAVWLLCVAVGHDGWSVAAADEQPTAPAAADDDREQRVVAFVAAHQPELAEVLAHLRKRKPADQPDPNSKVPRAVRMWGWSKSNSLSSASEPSLRYERWKV